MQGIPNTHINVLYETFLIITLSWFRDNNNMNRDQ